MNCSWSFYEQDHKHGWQTLLGRSSNLSGIPWSSAISRMIFAAYENKKQTKTSVHMVFVDFFLSEMICRSQDALFFKLIKKCSRISPACCERNNFMAECELAEIKLLWFPTDTDKWIFRMKSFSPQARCFLTKHMAANSPRPFLTTLNHLTKLWRLEKNILGQTFKKFELWSTISPDFFANTFSSPVKFEGYNRASMFVHFSQLQTASTIINPKDWP